MKPMIHYNIHLVLRILLLMLHLQQELPLIVTSIILMQIPTKITPNLIRIQQHKTLSYNYHKLVPHRIINILKIKELRILQLLILIPRNLLKEDFKTLNLHIYQLILYIKCIQILSKS